MKRISTLFQIGLCTFGLFFASSQISSARTKPALAEITPLAPDSLLLLAQVTSDGTTNTQVDQNGSVAEITGGETRGDNLFHSFQDFSVPTNNEAVFNNANTIENIFSRVTGGNISNIDGVIRANGSANLFLINPAGIIFGENARLDLGGSFYGSTANSILFEDGEFSATDLENPPLLTINAPIGLGFRDNPGNIINRANFGLTEETLGQDIGFELVTTDRITNITGLQVNPGQNLALIGGNVTLSGSGITAPGGNVTLGGLSEAGTVAISPESNFSFPENVAKADLSLENNALVSVIGNGGGAIAIDVSNLTLSQQSQLRAGIAEGSGDSNTVAGDIVIDASDSVTLVGNGEFEDGDRRIDLNTGIFNSVGLSPARVENSNNNDVGNTAGSSGSIFIDTKALNITERSVISTLLYGVGNAGEINIDADTVTLNEATLTSQVGLNGVKGKGNSGDININSNNFTATNLSFVVTDNNGTGEGNAGDINLAATDSVVIEDNEFTAFVSEIGVDAVGNAGNINVVANSLDLENSVQLLTQVRGIGNTGSINLDIADSLVISGGAALQAQVLQGGEGTGGNITISANTFELLTNNLESSAPSNLTQILAQNQSQGDSGDIVIQVNESISLDNSNILSQIFQDGAGNAGDIKITADSLNLENNAQILTVIAGIGNAGSINLNISNSLIISSGAEIIAQVLFGAEGEGGNINIATANLSLFDGGIVSAETRGISNAGNLNIDVGNLINIDGFDSGLFSRTGGTGNAGTVNITASQLEVENDARIGVDNFIETELQLETAFDSSAQSIPGLDNTITRVVESINPVEGSGNAGTLEITADTIQLEDGGSLTAVSAGGDGGNIIVDSNLLTLRSGGNISATAGLQDTSGSGGNINIDSEFIVAFPGGNNDISANAFSGNGGNITIASERIFGIEQSTENTSANDITASSEVNNLEGTITIETIDINSIEGSAELSTNIIKSEQTIVQACQANREAAAKNGFTIEGRGGVRPIPDAPLDSHNVFVDEDLAESQPVSPPTLKTARGTIQPARGIAVTESGVILTAYRTNNAGDRLPMIESNCSSN